MLRTPTKRPSSRSPSISRPSKRALTSSPEEGELDDGSPHSQPKQSTSSLSSNTLPVLTPQSPHQLPAKPKNIPFPFKKKTESGSKGGLGGGSTKVGLGNHDRRGDSRGSRPADHWEPSSSYSRRDGASHRHSTDRDHNYNNGSSRSDSRRYDRDGFGARNNNNDRYWSDRDRDRSRTPRSRSRTPSSASPQRGRERHRLPAHRSPEFQGSFSPPPRNYDLDRRYRDYDRWDDRNSTTYRDSRYHDSDDYSRRNYDRHVWDRDRDRGDGDRHWRPNSPPRRDAVGRSPYYRPVSPSRSVRTPPPLSPAPTNTQESQLHSPPPPPLSPPPPPPPVDGAHLEKPTKDAALPQTHASVSINLKRPGAPREQRSPESISLSAVDQQVKEIGGMTTNGIDKGQSRPSGLPLKPQTLPSGPQPGPEAPKKRPPLHRSRKEEEAAYGRVFVGCGVKDDYEMTTKLGEGTFGEVHKAICKNTGATVALKRILMHNEKEGMPVTALREIKILKALRHPCIVELLDMFVVRSNSQDALSVYMVFPYMDHDLAGLLENERVRLQPSHIKLYMKQLLEGTEYMHRNNILHRDMKAANLLISNSGSLQIADFGLARAFDPLMRDHRGRERKYTNCVVTRWYRPPELLLGARQYGGEVDIWGIGCVLGEMFQRRPILPGTSDLDQLEKIWQLCGNPNQHSWPNFDSLPGCEGVIRFSNHTRRVKQVFESLGPETCDLLDKMLTCNPRERITALQALDHDYFWTDPLPADPKTLPSYDSSHEFDRRGRRQHPPPQQLQQAGPPPHAQPPPHMGGSHLPPGHGPPGNQLRPPGPGGPPGYFHGRGGPPPPREAFRNGPPLGGGGPPPPHMGGPPIHMGGGPPGYAPHGQFQPGPPMQMPMQVPPYGPGPPGFYGGPPPPGGYPHHQQQQPHHHLQQPPFPQSGPPLRFGHGPPPQNFPHPHGQPHGQGGHWGNRNGGRGGGGGGPRNGPGGGGGPRNGPRGDLPGRPPHLPPRPSAPMGRGPNEKSGGGEGGEIAEDNNEKTGNGDSGEGGGTTELNYG